MGDMIDRDAVLALFNDWLLYAPSGHSVTYEVCEAIRAIPAADARAEALRLQAYLDRRKRAHGFDQTEIHSFDVGCDTEVTLAVADLETVLRALIPETKP